MVQVSK
jgi:hypothetical protein